MNTSSTCLVLARRTSAAFRVPRPFTILSTQKELPTFQELFSALLDKISILRAKSTEATVKAQTRYKTNIDEKVWQTLFYNKGDLIYLRDDLPRKYNDPSHKLKPKKSGLLVVVAAKPKTITIVNDGADDTVSIDRISIVKPKDENCQPSQPHTKKEYVADRIVGHSVTSSRILYSVHCYKYSPKDNTSKPEEKRPSHSKRWYW